MSTAPLRVLVADDHPLFRAGVRALLETASDTQVVGFAASGDEAVALAERLRPDVVLMDLQMPGGGIEATRRVLAARPGAAVLVVTMFEDDYSVFAAMRAGARGYVLKDADEEDLLRAVRAVGRGEAIFSPAIARRLVEFFAGHGPPAPSRAFPELTERERQVLDLIAQGVSNAAIAERLVLSPRRCATTSPASSRSCRWWGGPRRSSAPAGRAWADHAALTRPRAAGRGVRPA